MPDQMWSFGKKVQAAITVSDDSFTLMRDGKSLGRVRFEDIESIEAYKRDELTTDLICFDILVVGDRPMTWFLHEETEGWTELVERLQRMPGFDALWLAKVMKPAFAENRTAIYRRG